MKRIILLTISLLITLSAYVFGSEPTKEPILRIETGMHTAAIRRIGIDAQNRYLVTGSQDKTVRLWELNTGRLIRTIRMPIIEGDEGTSYAVAISPDGNQIRSSNAELHLTYSKDGRYLVATLFGNNGIRVYRTPDYSPVAEDKDYGSDSYGADFDGSGRLVTTSLDGYIRLYDKNFKLIKKRKAPGGERPFHISFSPDGSRIVVGYNDTTNVDILSGKDLSKISSLDTKGVENGDLASVAWSLDGRFIYAGGTGDVYVDDEWKTTIRRWEIDDGSGFRLKGFKDIPVSDSTIMQILPLNGGGVVFGTAEPSFGIVDGAGRLALYKSSDIADFRSMYENFLISYDGSVIQFGYEYEGKSPARFDVREKRLDIDLKLSSSRLNPPLTESDKIKVTDWKANYHPKLNGKEIELERYEFSRSLAISPDERSFLLGADWYVRCYDSNGNLLWIVPAPGAVWGVNVSGNGKVGVAAFGDGTIRWFRMSDGSPLLALFPHKDRKRWVLWTPSGYYDASVGGEELIGWHINNGKDKEADFFPVAKFRNRFFRPDIVAKVLETLDEKEAIKIASEESGKKTVETKIADVLPPVVTILSPQDESVVSKSDITIRFSIRNPSKEPVTNVKVLVDGRPLTTSRGIAITPKGEEVREIKVTIPERDCEVSVVAENKYSASEPATIRLKWKGEKKEEFIIKPKLYILAIGVSRYDNKDLRLQFASKDAEDFVEAMKSQKGFLYEDVIVRLITDEKATKDNILDGLEWLERQVTSKDIAMVFIAGHGINDPSGIYYFLPANADIEKLKRTAVPYSDIKNTVSSLAGKVVMFVDTCHSGNVMGRRAITDITGVINELSSAENGVVVFASSTGRQYSLEDPKWENGAFTKALVEGIRGRADMLGKGKVTINMLDAYLAERVKELTSGKQTPVSAKPNTVPDFPIAVKR